MLYLKLIGFILLQGIAVFFIKLFNLLDIALYVSMPILTFLYGHYLLKKQKNKTDSI